jgi:hypothetical protein
MRYEEAHVLHGIGGSRKGEMFAQFKAILVCFFDHKGIVHDEFI